MSPSAKIAIITLTQSSDRDLPDTSELVNEIHKHIQTSELSKTWSIENVAVIDDVSPTAKALRTKRQDNLMVP